jgi:hypothetical protein
MVSSFRVRHKPGLDLPPLGYTCVHEQFATVWVGDSGGKKRSPGIPTSLAVPTFRQLCLRELSLFALIVGCTRFVLLAKRPALLASRLEMV